MRNKYSTHTDRIQANQKTGKPVSFNERVIIEMQTDLKLMTDALVNVRKDLLESLTLLELPEDFIDNRIARIDNMLDRIKEK